MKQIPKSKKSLYKKYHKKKHFDYEIWMEKQLEQYYPLESFKIVYWPDMD